MEVTKSLVISLPPYTRVVVALDGTPEAAEALPTAAAISAACGAVLETVSVTRTPVAAEMRSRVVEQLTAKNVTTANIGIDCESPSGSALVNPLLENDRSSDESTLVVATTRGRAHTGELRGSFAANVLGESGGPLLLVGPQCRRPFASGGGRRLVVAEDDPNLDRQLTTLVRRWAETFDLRLERLHVEGRHVIDGIVKHVNDDDVAAVVVASHSRSTVGRAIVGSVATGVVSKARCPVLIVRPQAMTSHSLS